MIILIQQQQHFVPITGFTISHPDLLLGTKSELPSPYATISIRQFKALTANLPPTTNLRLLNNHYLIFGFRIINQTIALY